MTPTTAVSRCRACDAELVLEPDDAWLLCARCGRAVAIDAEHAESGLELVRFTTRGYEGAPAMPFFRFHAPEVDGTLSESARQRVTAITSIWVIATRLRRFQGFGDVSYEYTRRPPRLEECSAPATMIGATRTLSDAEKVARVLLWRAFGDDRLDPECALSATLGQPQLCYVPVHIDDGLIKFPHCPIRYPSSVLERKVSASG